jgi:transposase
MGHETLNVTERDRRLLDAWIRAGTTPQRVVRRARIVLLAGEGRSIRAIAGAIAVNPRTVTLWRRRYEHSGPIALWRDAPGRGRRPTIPAATVHALLASPPPEGARWTIRRIAEATGLSRASVHRVLRRAAETSNMDS